MLKYTASTAFLEALVEQGVSYIFANWGSDHPALIESLSEAKVSGRKVPKVITCPNEMVALSAAHGYAQSTGFAQVVIVHVDCGTQALAGAIHNVSKARIPVLIFAGASPYTQDGELKGSRNEFIQWTQDVFDQRGIVRGYVKYDNEIRTGHNIKQMVHRAFQFAKSQPTGPVYLMGAREVMEEMVDPVITNPKDWPDLNLSSLLQADLEDIVEKLITAKRPLIVTSFLGRNTQAVSSLVQLCQSLAIGVLESVPSYVNFPASNPMHQGIQWNEQSQNQALSEADFILILNSDVPWIPLVNHPPKNAIIYLIDVDPIKEQMPLWQIPTKRIFRADVNLVLQQLNTIANNIELNKETIEERRNHYTKRHIDYRAKIENAEKNTEEIITPEILTACIRECIDDNVIILNEGVTNYKVIFDHLGFSMPGAMFISGGGSLGWNGGAAIGFKLANPDKTIISLTGDGSYMFSIPSTVHWIAKKYDTPFLQIIYNNQGWKAPKFSTLALHPDGYASHDIDLSVNFDPVPDYSGIAAAAGGAFAQIIHKRSELAVAISNAINKVRNEKQSVVLDVWLPHL